jgi:hypothetical protein
MVISVRAYSYYCISDIYGDTDDRVRAISLAMGMVPIIWTSAPASGPFDTNGE